MPQIIKSPTIIKAAGNKIKQIEEYFGLVNSRTQEVSIARMISPEGWEEPGQSAAFDEYTVVLKGTLKAKTRNGDFKIIENQGILIKKAEWVQFSTPYKNGAEYISVCLPAFSPNTVNRDS